MTNNQNNNNNQEEQESKSLFRGKFVIQFSDDNFQLFSVLSTCCCIAHFTLNLDEHIQVNYPEYNYAITSVEMIEGDYIDLDYADDENDSNNNPNNDDNNGPFATYDEKTKMFIFRRKNNYNN